MMGTGCFIWMKGTDHIASANQKSYTSKSGDRRENGKRVGKPLAGSILLGPKRV